MSEHAKRSEPSQPGAPESPGSDWIGWFGSRNPRTALLVSATLHGLVVLLCAMIGLAARSDSTRVILSQIVDEVTTTDLMEILEEEPLGLEQPTAVVTGDAGSFAPMIDPSQITPPRPIDALPTLPELELPLELEVAEASIERPNVEIRGIGAEHVDGPEGAVDRIAVEIVRHLEHGPTLVVWAFDASGSLLAERGRIAQRIAHVYEHVLELDGTSLSQNGGLLGTVVGFGQGRRAQIPEPTTQIDPIVEAIAAIPLDESGVENTFTMVGQVAGLFGSYKRDGRPYQTMLVVVTDEVGDDLNALEPAIASARRADMKCYIIGSSAVFGREIVRVRYTDPRTGQTYNGLPIRQGPESLRPEVLALPFWFGSQPGPMDSSFGTFALSRLATQTGGIYFVVRMGSPRRQFDPSRMLEYQPEWISPAQFGRMLNEYPLRAALVRAVEISRERVPGQPRFTFTVPADTEQFRDQMTQGQRAQAQTRFIVEAALSMLEPVRDLRDREPSPRWRAHFDLIYGRLLAMKVRCFMYDASCAQMKNDPLPFQNPNSNAWRLRPIDEIILGGPTVTQAADRARQLLQRVVDEHPESPWALLAQRELRDPLGMKWVETYREPPRRNPGNNNAPNSDSNRDRPQAPPPKL